MGISSYSTTPASNTSISGINIAEGCAPSGINDAIRQMMADIATDVRPQQLPTATGTANAIVVALSPALTSYAAGQKFEFLPGFNNTGAVTINYGGGVIDLQKRGGLALAANDILTGVPAVVEHDGTRATLMNPQPHTHGADIASAATVNLDNATGDYVYITGTTGITAITLAEGRQVATKFAAAVAITAGASLVPPGNVSYTTVANDVIVWRGEASGVVRAVGGAPASGQNFVANLPTGAVTPYAGSTAPAGWLFCYGQAVSRTTYAALFAVTSTLYGVGDGSTTFNLPDLRGRTAFGDDNMGGSTAGRVTSAGSGITGTTLGATGGSESKTLTTTELPAHTHTGTTNGGSAHKHFAFGDEDSGTSNDITATDSTANNATAGSSYSMAPTPSVVEPSVGFTSSESAHTHTFTSASSGSGSAFGIMPPTIILSYIIKT